MNHETRHQPIGKMTAGEAAIYIGESIAKMHTSLGAPRAITDEVLEAILIVIRATYKLEIETRHLRP